MSHALVPVAFLSSQHHQAGRMNLFKVGTVLLDLAQARASCPVNLGESLGRLLVCTAVYKVHQRLYKVLVLQD